MASAITGPHRRGTGFSAAGLLRTLLGLMCIMTLIQRCESQDSGLKGIPSAVRVPRWKPVLPLTKLGNLGQDSYTL